MGESLISYKTMVATQYSSYWAFGSMLAAIVSACATLITLHYARKALDTWKQQEALKIKIDFKSAAVDLLYALDAMPDNWSHMHVNLARVAIDRGDINSSDKKREVQIFYLKQDMVESNRMAERRWMMCKPLLKDSEMPELWKKFQHDFWLYSVKGGNKAEILPLLKKVVDEMVIF
ncbi:hypothetical protein HA48_14580 [Pantoea wallisii]|uniref:DUF4760 domain-containing protein n=1 Tax=Pantoea wallisii TaxID=1076551 RepID=A0A1X1D735_9GAMM|nr:hypothetical protein [Pantoea wallisii]ORM72380.1 hypothetical protein HA48_14580 [Pantoea wallisii]